MTIELIKRVTWLECHAYLRLDRYDFAPFIPICEELPENRKRFSCSPSERAIAKARQGVELVSSGEIKVLNASGQEVPSDGQTLCRRKSVSAATS